ncbi:MAG: regulatory protein TetR [Frankiales bacterium]|nr:regulatory protein TetR [Frankiales bacterium]
MCSPCEKLSLVSSTYSEAETPLRRAATVRALADRQAGHAAEVTRLVEAAYRLIRRHGVVTPGVRELLAEAGLASRSFYRHFPSKDDFWLVVVEDLQAHLTARVTEAMQAQPEPEDRVRAWMVTVLDQSADADAALVGRPVLVHGARLREAYPDVYRATGAALLDLLEQAIRDAVACDQLHSVDPRADARAIFHLVMTSMQSHVFDRTVPSAAEHAAVVDFAFRALQRV